MGDLDALIVEARDRISAIISKPKMTEKLLQKPPFRFLHDTVSAIASATGFGDGLYSGEELDSAAITDKFAKIAYLDKIFLLVGICKGETLEVRSLKVVQGLEAELTNKFLIALAEVASDRSIDNALAVTRTLAGEAPGQNPPPRRGAAVPAPRSEAKDSNPSAVAQAQAKASPASIPEERKAPAKELGLAGSLDVPMERGKSRGGTRGGKPNQVTADVGLSGPPVRLDSEIERCDGSEALTQQLLGELIARPKLTEKLLSKPPFRFLHDIITELIRTTGFMKGLYSEVEMDSANVTSREQKIEFLDKAISLVGRQLGTIVEAKSAKIVAGLDAQITNIFLQLMAVAAKNMSDSSQAVRAVLETIGSNGGAAVAAPTGGGGMDSASTFQAAVAAPKEVSRQSVAEESKRPAAKSVPNATPSIGREPMVEAKAPLAGHAMSPALLGDPMMAADDKPDPVDGDDAGLVKRSTRPTTAGRRPPKIKDAATELAVKDVAPTNAAGQVKRAAGIIVDGAGGDDDDNGEVIEETNMRLVDEFRAENKGGADDNNGNNNNSNGGGGAQSKLVQNIMSRQVEQEAATRKATTVTIEAAEETKGDAAAAGGGIRLTRRGKSGSEKGGASSKGNNAAAASALGASILQTFAEGDIEKMRGAIQSLVQQTGPLGTCLDFIQEDISLMNAELHKWEEECRRYEGEHEEAKRKTKEKLHPLRSELSDLEDQITEQLAVIAATKASNFKLEDKIQSILKMIATA